MSAIILKQMQKSYNEGYQDALAVTYELLENYASQFGEDTNTRIALRVAAEGIRDLREAHHG
jgi:hypothetical protein